VATPAPVEAPGIRAAGAAGTAKSDVAMPAAAKLMADHQLTAGSVAGTGKDGRVTKGDVLGVLAMPKSAPVAPPAAAAVVKPLPARGGAGGDQPR